MTRITVQVHRGTGVYWADSPDLDGLTVEASSREELRQEAQWAAETLLDLQGIREKPELVFEDAPVEEISPENRHPLAFPEDDPRGAEVW